ncbi:hypothetical protein SAMN05192552_10645 [Natrinema hispanicum]|uniref:Uncharacterized protein n=1 Tax=Natrinema hispanicum TaxID=392421 RepID=A0A1G6YFI8_9EURY|nr:hypothetical protein SAMN05192552_10645 [Natrinema hispanicum]SEU03269.1 hypothetical protein SAMN04488694_12926 [Natrinema hispanicum]
MFARFWVINENGAVVTDEDAIVVATGGVVGASRVRSYQGSVFGCEGAEDRRFVLCVSAGVNAIVEHRR